MKGEKYKEKKRCRERVRDGESKTGQVKKEISHLSGWRDIHGGGPLHGHGRHGDPLRQGH